MILLSNCLTDIVDEGCLKVANSLAKRIKQADDHVTVLSIRRRSKLTDAYMEVNKLLLSPKLIRFIRGRKEPVLYIPFPTRSIPTAFRIFWLSWFSPKQVSVVLTMTPPQNTVSKLLLRLSRAHLYALSKEAADFYAKQVNPKRVTYLRTGVDTNRFVPVNAARTAELKKKYGLDPNKKVVLHVGHLKAGRNVAQLIKVDSAYQVLLVVSTFTKDSQDVQLKERLEKCGNITIMDGYIPHIEEIYQLADVYFFPVTEQGNCIDVPLSCLEAAACGKPVLTTAYGEMRELMDKEGFYSIEKMEAEEINRSIRLAITDTAQNPREAVMAYDWSQAVRILLEQ